MESVRVPLHTIGQDLSTNILYYKNKNGRTLNNLRR